MDLANAIPATNVHIRRIGMLFLLSKFQEGGTPVEFEIKFGAKDIEKSWLQLEVHASRLTDS